jgi:hypothetical protein
MCVSVEAAHIEKGREGSEKGEKKEGREGPEGAVAGEVVRDGVDLVCMNE